MSGLSDDTSAPAAAIRLAPQAPAQFGDRLLHDQFKASLPRRICTGAGPSPRTRTWLRIAKLLGDSFQLSQYARITVCETTFGSAIPGSLSHPTVTSTHPGCGLPQSSDETDVQAFGRDACAEARQDRNGPSSRESKLAAPWYTGD